MSRPLQGMFGSTPASTKTRVSPWKSLMSAPRATRLVAIAPYNAVRADELSLRVGDECEGLTSEDGWWWGAVLGGHGGRVTGLGYFPANFVLLERDAALAAAESGGIEAILGQHGGGGPTGDTRTSTPLSLTDALEPPQADAAGGADARARSAAAEHAAEIRVAREQISAAQKDKSANARLRVGLAAEVADLRTALDVERAATVAAKAALAEERAMRFGLQQTLFADYVDTALANARDDVARLGAEAQRLAAALAAARQTQTSGAKRDAAALRVEVESAEARRTELEVQAHRSAGAEKERLLEELEAASVALRVRQGEVSAQESALPSALASLYSSNSTHLSLRRVPACSPPPGPRAC